MLAPLTRWLGANYTSEKRHWVGSALHIRTHLHHPLSSGPSINYQARQVHHPRVVLAQTCMVLPVI